MKNLKYIYALSSLFVSFFAFSYATNFIDSSSLNNNKNNEEKSNNSSKSNVSKIEDNLIKSKIISEYNNHFKSSSNLKLTNGNLISLKNNYPVSLKMKGNYNLNSNSLSSYVIDTDYSYNSNKENFKVSYGSTGYSAINYNDKVYLFKSNNELDGILSFPSTIDNKYPLINENKSFSSIFNEFLSLDNKYEVYESNSGYSFISNEININTDNDFNLTKVEGKSDDIKYEFNFETQSLTESITSLNSSSKDIITTLKSLLEDSSFDINFNADIKSKTSNNLKFIGNLKLDYLNASVKDDPLIGLSLTHYTNNNLSNEVFAQYDNNDIYFKVNNLLKGSISDTTANELISLTSGLMSDSSFNYDFNKPLNNLINTEIFKNIMDLDISSLNTSYISNLEIKHNLISFGLDSKIFNLDNGIIRFEIGLNNAKLKSLKIKDFNVDNDKSMNIELYFNTPKGLNHLNKNEYPSYNSMLPIYKNIISIMKEGKIGGDFSTSTFDSNSSTTLGLSTHYDFNFKKALSNLSIDDLIVSLSDLKINFIDETDDNRESNITTALFLEDTLESSKSSFNIEISNLNYQNDTFYINLDSNKYVLESKSLKDLIENVKTLSDSNNSSSSTSKGFNAIKNEIERLDYLIYFIKNNDYVKNAINNIKNNYSLKELENFFTISNLGDGIYNLEFDMYNLVGQNSFVFRDYDLSHNCSLLIGGNGSLLGINVSGLSVDGLTTSTHLGKTYYDSSNVLSESDIKEEWTNTESEPNKVQDLSKVVDSINNVVNAFNSFNIKNATISNLINLSFEYGIGENKKSLNGYISSKLHFNDNKKIDDKYIEGNLPLSLNSKTGVNDVSGLNMEFIYSDNDLDKSNFKNLVNDKTRIKAGTQVGVSLNYSSNKDDSRNKSKLYGYSSNDTVMDILKSLSELSDQNTLYPYTVVQNIQKYSSTILNILNNSSSNSITTMDILKKLGINDTKTLIDLLNGLNSNDQVINAKVNLGKLSNNQKLESLNLLIEIKISKDSDNNFKFEYVHASSINELEEKDGNLNVKLDIEESKILLDENNNKESIKDTDKIQDILSTSFEPLNKVDKTCNYIDASNIYNLLSFGIETTNKKYYNIKGNLNFDSSASFASIKDAQAVLLNNLYFDIKLNLIENKNNIYNINAYLKVSIADSDNIKSDYKNQFTEFFIESGDTNDEGTIYVMKTNYNSEDIYSEIITTENSEQFKNSFYDSKLSKDYKNYELLEDKSKTYKAGETITSFDKKYLAETSYNESIKNNPELAHQIKISSELKTVATINKITSTSKQKTFYSLTKFNSDTEENRKEALKEIKQQIAEAMMEKLQDYQSDKYTYDMNKFIEDNMGDNPTPAYDKKKKTYSYKFVIKTPLEVKDKEEGIFNIYYDLKNENATSTLNAYVYRLESKYSYNTEMYKMSKSNFLGKISFASSSKITGDVPLLLYYLLDYSEILSSKASIKSGYLELPIRNLLLNSIYSSLCTSSTSPRIDYLNGFNLNVNDENKFNEIVIIPSNILPDGLGDGNNSQITFETSISLTKNDNNQDESSFTLNQTDEDKNLVSASASLGNLKASINIKLLKSDFFFISSNNEVYINSKMNRYTTFIKSFNSNDLTKDNDYIYPISIFVNNDNPVLPTINITYNDEDGSHYIFNALHDSDYFEGL